MSTVRFTEERLRTWALAQEERERMCLGILSLDPRYSNVKPRRPKGGPDGGRDIEAVFSDRTLVWVGVGFRNNAIDSTEDKRWNKWGRTQFLLSLVTERSAIQGRARNCVRPHFLAAAAGRAHQSSASER